MLYLLFVLTFLAGILFYGLSPSDKGVEMTARQAEGMIVTFLAQHQAAKDYLYTWLGASNTANTGNLQEDNFLKAEYDANEKPTLFNFETMMPRGVISDMCKGNNGVPGEDSCRNEENEAIPGFVSRVFCLNGDGDVQTDCTDNNKVKKRYIATYGGWRKITVEGGTDYDRPDWWPPPGQKMRRFESWRRAIANRTRGSISCGTLVEVETGKWCIDNGENIYKSDSDASPECRRTVPNTILTAIKAEGENPDSNYFKDMLFCLTEFKQGTEHYVSGMTHFYDALANQAVGSHDGNATTWQDLASDSSSITKGDQDTWGDAWLVPSGWVKTGIQLGETFTLTVVVRGTNGVYSLPFHILSTANSVAGVPNTHVFFKIGANTAGAGGNSENADNNDNYGIQLNKKDAPPEKKKICTTNGSLAGGIIAWTVVVYQEGGTTKIDVYENATKRFDGEIDSVNGRYLVLGDDSYTEKQSPNLYSIKYYDRKLTQDEIQQNFKVDEKRFGLSDANSGQKSNDCPS